MEKFIRNRVYFLMGFILYAMVVVIGISLYDDVPLIDIVVRLGFIFLGVLAGIIEVAIFANRSSTSNFNYRRLMPIFIGLILIFAIVGPVVMTLFHGEGLELGGIAFAVTGMTLTSKVFLDDEIPSVNKS